MKKTTIIFAICCFILSSCQNPFSFCLSGNNNYSSESRYINGFSEIESSGNFDVEIMQADEYSIIIEAEENLLPYIVTDVKNSVLTIKTRNKRCIDPNISIKVLVSAPEINSISLSGSGSIIADIPETNNLFLGLSGSGSIQANAVCTQINGRISGSGRITLLGSCADSELYISGSGDVNAYGMSSQRCFATISGSGDMFVSVSDLLDVKITGSGSVNYIGFPSLTTKITGSGSVNSQN